MQFSCRLFGDHVLHHVGCVRWIVFISICHLTWMRKSFCPFPQAATFSVLSVARLWFALRFVCSAYSPRSELFKFFSPWFFCLLVMSFDLQDRFNDLSWSWLDFFVHLSLLGSFWWTVWCYLGLLESALTELEMLHFFTGLEITVIVFPWLHPLLCCTGA